MLLLCKVGLATTLRASERLGSARGRSQLQDADGWVDLQAMTDEVVLTYIMELDGEGILKHYEQGMGNTRIYTIYHELRDPGHARAQAPMRFFRGCGPAHLKAGGNRSSPL